MDTLQKVLLPVLLSLYILINHGCMNIYTPYNITFNSDGFEWQGEGAIINIRAHERISFLFTVSSTNPITYIKYGIRIVSLYDNKLLQRPVYIRANDIPKKSSLNLTKASEFDIVIRGLIKVPDRFTNDTVWSVQDTKIIYTGRV